MTQTLMIFAAGAFVGAGLGGALVTLFYRWRYPVYYLTNDEGDED